MMHNDLFNLKPAIGIANGDRSDIPYGVVEAPNRYSGCEFKWSPEAVEPRDEVKGDIARIYFYMMETYPSRISIDQRFYTMLVLWSNIDPVDDKECEVERWIFAIQGNRNKFVYDHCKRR